MKKLLAIILFTLFGLNFAFAGQTIERHNFFKRYDPTATVVYDPANSSATGDQVAVNTYTRKTIQITPITVGEYVYITIEGRSLSQTNTPNWAILDVVEFSAASNDTAKQKAIDVTEYVDFIRVGIKTLGSNGTSFIDVEGLFTNLER